MQESFGIYTKVRKYIPQSKPLEKYRLFSMFKVR